MVIWRHVPSLFLATTFTFGGMLPLVKPQRAMREFGLPEYMIESAIGQSIFNIYSSRMTVLGLALYSFHYQGLYSAVDTILMCLGWAGVVDGYICWKEGSRRTAIFRSSSSVVLAIMGFFGITAGP